LTKKVSRIHKYSLVSETERTGEACHPPVTIA
jgi:hypothetical protein